ncbi:hypothetical protein GCM10009679_20350 [Saccharothrix algeriensis]|uniref:Lecithin:cholesterol acyltransferase n=1 Tax=Catellatospora bangladeshensis TaxID=310355 RepID=A0A8J3NJK3_9ACTN|nr:hypothetical protein Cba03nite_34420 [Catellatospora bangladeshensis]
MPTAVQPDTSPDAVVVVPGIMGSELVDAEHGRQLWGLSEPGWYVRAWTRPASLDALGVTGRERDGHVGRVRPVGLLRAPAFAPVLRGAEPYTALLSAVSRVVRHPDAVMSFPYDWRLPVAHTGPLLAQAAEQHLYRWRRHRAGSAGARLVVVAHSMGGLLSRHAVAHLGEQVRAVVTLGTPFAGSPKAAVMMSVGRGAPLPLPYRQLRDLCRTMPAMYDLLPAFPCVHRGEDVTMLTRADVEGFGADGDLFAQAVVGRREVGEIPAGQVRTVIGVAQPTVQGLAVAEGLAQPLFVTALRSGGGVGFADRRGDATVSREAAGVPGVPATYLAQSHGALPRAPEAIQHVCAVITETTLGQPLGPLGPGVDVPEIVTVGEPFSITLTEPHPGASCRIVDTASGRPVAHPVMRGGSGVSVLSGPGLFRVEVKAGGSDTVTQLLLAVVP